MADLERTAEILGKVPLFENLKKRQLQSLARIFIDRKCAPGEVIVPQGRDGYGFFIVASGRAEAVREKADGTTAVVNTFGPGDFFGELALLDNGPRTASVIATEETECLILPRENFLGVLRRDGEMAVDIMVELAKRFRMALDAYY
ncbi:MAG TPA: cyclic nucleotide-binding domain-containing protein [Anaerolineae bacterium]|nr:cyclic nucleotide-binding domain-containing protein [Anaerolineae bacterium]HQI87269.1 cyclic nucleotide-binding domain-containing protein [Anaerolineae bacterium]